MVVVVIIALIDIVVAIVAFVVNTTATAPVLAINLAAAAVVVIIIIGRVIRRQPSTLHQQTLESTKCGHTSVIQEKEGIVVVKGCSRGCQRVVQ